MKKKFYEKQGRKYVEVGEYDSDLMDSFPIGATLVVREKGCTSRKYNVEPAFVELLAAATIMGDELSQLIYKASEARPERSPITEEQRDAWQHLAKVMDKDLFMLQYGSCRDIAEKVLQKLQERAEGASANPLVVDARQSYITAVALTKGSEHADR